MIVRDMMPGFELYRPASLVNALELADRFGAEGWVMAGGNDSLAWFKDRAKRPVAVIDITRIAELKGVRETPDGLEIGALTTLTEIERDPLIRERFRILADAAAASRARRSATTAPSAATSRRTPAAGTTATACRAIGPGATPATPTRPRA
jgi:xanthine dehydrogenase YagS FAD-binding subunit